MTPLKFFLGASSWRRAAMMIFEALFQSVLHYGTNRSAFATQGGLIKNKSINIKMWQPWLITLCFLAILPFQHHQVEGCLCHIIPNYSCPPPPHCCESGMQTNVDCFNDHLIKRQLTTGQYTFDECGCCMTCAKAELQVCGGPNESSGKCAQGLSCLKTCSKS